MPDLGEIIKLLEQITAPRVYLAVSVEEQKHLKQLFDVAERLEAIRKQQNDLRARLAAAEKERDDLQVCLTAAQIGQDTLRDALDRCNAAYHRLLEEKDA